MAFKFQMDLFNPRIRTEEIKIKKPTTTTTTSPEITSSASSTHSTSSLTKPTSNFSSTSTTKKSKFTSRFSRTPKAEPTPEDHAKTKEMAMKYRNMTSEEADAYFEDKKKGDGMNTERGLRAFGMAVAPIRL